MPDCLEDPRSVRERLELAVHAATHIKRGLVVLSLRVHPSQGGFYSPEREPAIHDEMCRRIRSCLARTDFFCANHPLDYTIVLERAARSLFFIEVAEGILQAVAAPLEIGGQAIRAVGSIGISLYPDDSLDAEPLIDHAHSAMEGAFGVGGNMFGFYSATFGTEAERRLKIERALGQALDRQEFVLFYQPQVHARSLDLSGVEALMRWNTKIDGQAVYPGDFIPVLEQTGLINKVGRWVLEEACRQGQAWAEAGRTLRIGVNVSAHQLRQPDFAQQVEEALFTSGLDPRMLELELTEGVLVDNPGDARNLLESLRGQGVRVAIDDFGTGYASLSYIRQFPMDTIKIDRQFVTGLPLDNENAAISSAIVALAHSLDLETVAEGVENEAEQEFLRSLNCQIIQGFLHARPMPVAEFESWIAAR